MRDECEVREVALHGGIENRRRSRVAEWRPVLVEQVDELLDDLSSIANGHIPALLDSATTTVRLDCTKKKKNRYLCY